MPRFFSDFPPQDGRFIIQNGDYTHISRSLRMRTGDSIVMVFDKKDYVCRLSEITSDTVYADIISENPSKEPSIDVTVFQALPKQDKLELIVQKSVELGASRIVPVQTKFCVAKPDTKRFSQKIERLHKISEAAAKQSGRGIIPEISGIISFEECLNALSDCDMKLFLYEKPVGKRLLELDYSGVRTVGILIGSEGGFSEDEAEAAEKSGCRRIWLGNRILRCETAPICALSVIMAATGNL